MIHHRESACRKAFWHSKPALDHEAATKITVHVDRELLANAQKAAHAGISETMRKGLELLAASEACERLPKRGKVKFSSNLNELREIGNDRGR
jgi:hypothetical protein